MSTSPPKVEAFLSALKEQSFFKDGNTPGSVLWYIEFYQKRAPRRRLAFRASGFILLFLSISLPFITQVSPHDWQAQVASTLAWLIAESTGKHGKGILPAPDDPHAELHEEVRLPDPHELGQEFFRWEFAVAVAGPSLGINPFDQPDVQAAKDKTNEVLASGEIDIAPDGAFEEL